MEERLNKLLGLIESLPGDQILIIAEKCKGLGEISPKVRKLISVFEKLNDEEKQQFFRNVKQDDQGGIQGTESNADSMEGEYSE